MVDVPEQVWENSKSGDGPCAGCPSASGQYNHPGFFNFDADILVVEESPSFTHFEYPGYERGGTYEQYRRYYEQELYDILVSWDFYRVFLKRIFEPFGIEGPEIFDEIYMTSSVKCPVRNRNFAPSFEACRSYLELEIDEMEPEVVLAAGKLATTGVASTLGVSERETSRIRISRPVWWGLSPFDTDPPLVHVPHWGYYATHNRLSDEEWRTCIEAVQAGLRETVYD